MRTIGHFLQRAAFAASVAICMVPGQAQVLQPATYRSPSGRYALTVDPADRDGAAAASYVLRDGGKPMWSGERPFAFTDAVVTDDGSVGGYAYVGGRDNDSGEFVVAILDASGSMRRVERVPRVGSRYLHTVADPKSNGLLLVDGRLIVRIDDPDVNAASESWWSYRLRDGAALPKFQPRKRMKAGKPLRHVLDARAVAGTPLVLVQWMTDQRPACGPCRMGTRFALVDAAAKTVWTFDLPDDYSDPDEHVFAKRLQEANNKGAILDTSQPGHFEIREFASAQRLSFALQRDPDKAGRWKVSLSGRSPYVEPAPVVPDRSELDVPRALGVIVLQTGAPEASPVHDVIDFVIGGNGHFAFTTGCDCDGGRLSLAVVDADGALVRKVELPSVADHATAHVAWSGGDRWLVTLSPPGQEVHSKAVRVDASTGIVAAIEGFDGPDIEAVAGTRDGGFVALTSTWSVFGAMGEALQAYDGDGHLRWTVEGGSSRSEQVFSGKGLAVTESGDVVVLENVSDNVKVYANDGHFLRTIALDKAWGRKPNYPTGIAIDRAGDAVIHDFGGKPSVVGMSMQGKVTSGFDPAYANGRTFDVRGDIRVAPDGRLWTSDGDAFLRLDAKGKVDRVVGRAPDPDQLGDVSGMFVRPDGTSYAVDDRTGAVHRFDPEGRRTRIYRPAIDDYPGRLVLPIVSVSSGGDVYVSRRDRMNDQAPDYLHYADDGRRLGVEQLSVDNITQAWFVQPDGRTRWVLGYESIVQVDADGKVLDRIERDAQRQWLVSPGPAALASDGSLAVLSDGIWVQAARMRAGPTDGTIALYSPAGEALDAWPAPEGTSPIQGHIAYDGEHLAFLVARRDPYAPPDRVVVTDRRGKVLSRFKPPQAPQGVYFVRWGDVSEMWLFDGKASIARYAIPRVADGP